jgi:hypothetical protein
MKKLTDFPGTSSDLKQLALDLVAHLQGGVKDTFTQIDWTLQNIRLLNDFFRLRGVDCSFHGSERGVSLGLYRLHPVARHPDCGRI